MFARMKTVVMCAVAAMLLVGACKKVSNEDGQLFDRVRTTNGFTYYQNDFQYLSSSAQSGHNHPLFRVRFNSVAQAALDSSGKLPHDSVFPSGSLIVKELYDDNSGTIKLLAIMEKVSLNSPSGSKWTWAEYEPKGTVKVSLFDKGAQCISCHNTPDNRDFVRTFDLFP